VPGIVSSKIGTLDGNEVVRVEYDSSKANLPRLVETLKNNSSFYSLIAKNETERDRAKKALGSGSISVNAQEPDFVEPKYTLRTTHPELYYLDLTEQQAVVLNSWSYFGGPMPDVLTTEQKQLLPRLKAKLQHGSIGRITPGRNGEALASYHAQLLKWLE